MIEQVLGPRDRREGDVGFEALLLERGLVMALEDLGDPGDQPGPCLDALVVGREPGVGGKLVLAGIGYDAAAIAALKAAGMLGPRVP